MGIKDGTPPPQSSTILPFPAENQQPRLSIKIDDADTGIFYREYYSMVFNRCLIMLGNREDAQDEINRKIYFYKYHDDMTLEQIGEVVGFRKSAVQKRLKNLEEQVRVKMGKANK